jgi:hypothetical protein
VPGTEGYQAPEFLNECPAPQRLIHSWLETCFLPRKKKNYSSCTMYL